MSFDCKYLEKKLNFFLNFRSIPKYVRDIVWASNIIGNGKNIVVSIYVTSPEFFRVFNGIVVFIRLFN